MANPENLRPPWKPGESGNPEGRPAAGASIKEFTNILQGMTELEVRAIARDKSAPVFKRAAAERWLRSIEVCDIADFQAVLQGGESAKTLEQLRREGVNTEVVKKLKYGKDGPEIELHDRSGEDFDRICDRTDGKPTESLNIAGAGGAPLSVEIITPMSRRTTEEAK